jgi:alpha-glucosidase
MKDYILLFLALLFTSNLFADNELSIESPSGNLTVNIKTENNRLVYSSSFNNEHIIDYSKLGFVLKENDSLCFFRILKSDKMFFDETWKPVWGQYSDIRNNYSQITIHLQDIIKNRLLDVCFRVFDDGFAFQYNFPEYNPDIIIMSEENSFNFTENNNCWWIWADYNTLEKLYHNTSLKEASHVASSFTMQTGKGTYISIHEAAIDDYSSMTLKQDSIDSLNYKVNLVPWADGSAVKTSAPFKTPWRVVFVSSSAGGLAESSLLLNLNEPSVISDCSWIKPIKYIGIWWEMHLGISTWAMKSGRHGATTENAKRYIDFASKNGLEGLVIEGWNMGWENWGAKDAFDFITSYPDFKIKEVVDYARSKGVEIIGHHETGGDIIAYEKNLDAAFAFYNSLGIKYVKTGYAGPVNPTTEHHHGQYMVRHYNKVMRTAAKYKIMLDVHEPIIPSGWSRTYPNLMTFEGVRGMEWNAWSSGNPPSHTCILPFTRGLAGPMDYTPGIFDISEQRFADKRVKWNGPDTGKTSVHSTLCNQIALMVVLYSPLQMAADLIENYENHPAFKFVAQIPTTWDETKVLYWFSGNWTFPKRYFVIIN